MINDPLGLLDRDLTNWDTCYRTVVTDADAKVAVIIEWHVACFGGPPVGLQFLEHIDWRMTMERDRWRTMRNALQEAAPLPNNGHGGGSGGGGEPIPIPPGPTPGPVAGALSIAGRVFRLNGEPWTWIGASDFCLLQNELVEGTDPGPILEQRAALGFNVIRVWGMGDWADMRYRLYPQEHGQRYFDVLYQQIERARALGMLYEFNLFMDVGRVMPHLPDQQEFYRRTQEVLHDLGELVNENDLSVNHINTDAFPAPRPGLLFSRGSNGANQQPVTPPWTHGTFHPARDWDWALEVGHHAMEQTTALGVPVVSNENKRPDQAGFKVQEFYDAAVNGSLLGPGSTFHSEQGKLSELLTGATFDCAVAWVAGARAIPLEFQTGSYTAGHLHDCPVEQRAEWAQQVYGRILGNRACCAYMYATPAVQVVPKNGWRVVEQRRGPVVLLER